MIISDQRFGCQLVTRKGRVFKFDDLCCMHDFVKTGAVPEADILQRYVSDFNRPNHFIPAERAFFLRRAMRSPMASNTPAFGSTADRETVRAQLGKGEDAPWSALTADN
jgi:copper chaperone NosL